MRTTPTKRLPWATALIALLALALPAWAKTVYWPSQFNQYPEVSYDRSAESDNFVVFWGTLAGLDPTTAPADIRFDPASVLSQLESVYTTYIDQLGYLDDTVGNLALYKIIVVMNDTWSSAPWTGWAFGGPYDSTIGAMWVHPGAVHEPSWVLAHEFAHSLQNQVWIDNPGHGFINFEPTGFFWETHAQFMAEQHYPTILEGTDFIRFFNTAHFHWGSTRHHYGNTLFLRYLQDTFGIELVNRLWRESIAGSETPIDTLKRIEGWSQQTLNDQFGHYAMRNVTFDYSNGAEMRHTVQDELDHNLIARMYTALEPMLGQPGAYKVPAYTAPQDYGYNIVQLIPDSPDATIHMTFYGQENTPAGGAGYRFGFVAVDGDTPRYSPLYKIVGGIETDVSFTMQPNEDSLYLVVLGAPQTHHDYVWEPGWPKIWRYPWQIRLDGATPTVNNHKGIAGHTHVNGGGFVAATAHVTSNVYVGPNAQVLGNAQVSGNVRIEDQASVVSYTNIYGDITIRDAAYVGWATLRDSVLLDESAMHFGDASGTFHAGGDAEGPSPCSEGYYRQVPHPNNGREWCDGLTDHPANIDINPEFPDHVFSPRGCNPADLAEPFGLLDLDDISGFISAFIGADPAADLNGDGLLDLGDLQVFVTSFLAGCP
ncbi:MAG: hypothetical protein H6810_04565 [Phycisphaeraceae bacterium]|nr:MAG: hypothetical protein H6810_04565 [Phycisphaeraceae bacterium]